jgi:hypothetical protein
MNCDIVAQDVGDKKSSALASSHARIAEKEISTAYLTTGTTKFW